MQGECPSVGGAASYSLSCESFKMSTCSTLLTVSCLSIFFLHFSLFLVSVQDAMRSVTKQAVKEARLKEIKQELLNSEKLKVSCGYPDAAEDLCKRFGIGCFFYLVLYFVLQTYFEDNPRDLQLLRHDKDLHPAVVKPHLKNVPEYLGKERAHSHTQRL